MKAAIITIAGMSSRFNRGIPEDKHALKAIYTEDAPEATLLYHLLQKCAFADRIILVGGYRFSELEAYVRNCGGAFPQIILVRNERYADLGSGFSLYLGVQEALRLGAGETLFAEGDLDVDREAFASVAASHLSVLTYTNEPIYANKAVALYANAEGNYKYVYNSAHGLLTIDEPFSCVLNSGQVWKFARPETLEHAAEDFGRGGMEGTNLEIIQRYVAAVPKEEIELIRFNRWTNCNTRADYQKIREGWTKEP